MSTNHSRKVYLCAPTYREPHKVASFLRSLRAVRFRPLEVRIVNAAPGDEVSRMIRDEARTVDYHLIEVEGIQTEFWSGTINRALRQVLEVSADDDWVLLMNIDITFDHDVISDLLNQAILFPGCQVSALSHCAGHVISSGVKVRSWFLGLNRHPMTGQRLTDVPNEFVEEVDFLPSRCLLFAAVMLRRAGLIAERQLPHYNADYEFTHRLISHGCRAFIIGSVRVEGDLSNTGASVFARRTTFWQRLGQVSSIRNPSNIRYRIRFVRMVYPPIAQPTAMLSYFARSVLEVVLGGDCLRHLMPGPNRGFSQ